MREMNIAEIKESLSYCADTGIAKWMVKRTGKAKEGSSAGYLRRDGYLEVKINNVSFLLHRVIWALHYGVWHKGEIDHIDGNKTNNRIANLRAATKSENQRNAGLRFDNKSGCPGVCWYKQTGKWVANITLGNKRKHLGFFDKLEDAIAARKQADKDYGFHKNHGARNSFKRRSNDLDS